MKLHLTTAKYIEMYPETPKHMYTLPHFKATIDSGMFKAGASLGWPQYEGGYIHWQLMDIRIYVKLGLTGWAKESDNPFRIYIKDYDDWNVEGLFKTEDEAREVIKRLSVGVVTAKDIKASGLRTM